jgi:putative membrane protein
MSQETRENHGKSPTMDSPHASTPVLAADMDAAGSGKGTFRIGLAAALGFGPGRKVDAARVDEGTRLAVERSYLAAERTLMAWIRTALSMISFGFTIGKLGQTVTEIQVKGVVLGGARMVSIESVAYFLVILGTLALLAAILQYIANTAEYAVMGLRRRVSISFIVGLVLVLLGGYAFSALVLKL